MFYLFIFITQILLYLLYIYYFLPLNRIILCTLIKQDQFNAQYPL